MRQPRILMCPPDYYGIEYEINPWMSRARGSTPERAAAAVAQPARDAARPGRRSVELMTPQPGLPDLVFTANAGLMFGKRFFSSRFRHEVRARETPYFDAWFAAHGFTVEHLPEGMFFEGAGDALFCGATLFAGYRIRSDVQGHTVLASDPGQRVLPLELVNPGFYHLDTCFCPLAPGEAIYYPAGVRRLWPQGARGAHPAADARVEAESACASAATRWWSARPWSSTPAANVAADLHAWGYAGRTRAGRIPQGRRQRQVPDAAPRRRGSGRLGLNEPATRVPRYQCKSTRGGNRIGSAVQEPFGRQTEHRRTECAISARRHHQVLSMFKLPTILPAFRSTICCSSGVSAGKFSLATSSCTTAWTADSRPKPRVLCASTNSKASVARPSEISQRQGHSRSRKGGSLMCPVPGFSRFVEGCGWGCAGFGGGEGRILQVEIVVWLASPRFLRTNCFFPLCFLLVGGGTRRLSYKPPVQVHQPTFFSVISPPKIQSRSPSTAPQSRATKPPAPPLRSPTISPPTT